MNAGLCIFDLPPAERDAHIERAISDMRKTVALYRVKALINSLPVAAEKVTPSANSAAASAFHLEQA